MKAVTPNASDATKRTVHGFRDPDRQPAHAALEARRVVGFHQQVDVVDLHAELEHAKAGLRRQAERALNGDERSLIAQ